MKQNLKNILIAVLVLFLLGAGGATYYFYNEYQKVKKNPDLISKEEVKSVTSIISKYMDLPSEEQPTVATVTDKEKLKDQDFFKKAENGDKILIYTNTRKAILFRPSTGRVVEFAPLILGADQASSTEQSSIPNKVNVAIYNGTSTNGLTSEYEKKLEGNTELEVTDKANASKKDYTETLIIDVSGKNKDMAEQIANLLGGKVVEQIPEGENKPASDILIIIGKGN